MNRVLSFLVLFAIFLMTGCATTPMSKTDDGSATATAIKFVDSHAEILSELTKINGDTRQLSADNQKTLETAHRSLEILEKMSGQYEAGEITLFFTINTANLEHADRERLISFADYLSRESQGRKVLFVSIGSASSLGNYKFNLKLAKNRSEVPKNILDKYLINIPHEFYHVYGTGDIYSPKNVQMKEHQRYQHVRVIAVFDQSQLPQVKNPPTN